MRRTRIRQPVHSSPLSSGGGGSEGRTSTREAIRHRSLQSATSVRLHHPEREMKPASSYKKIVLQRHTRQTHVCHRRFEATDLCPATVFLHPPGIFMAGSASWFTIPPPPTSVSHRRNNEIPPPFAALKSKTSAALTFP